MGGGGMGGATFDERMWPGGGRGGGGMGGAAFDDEGDVDAEEQFHAARPRTA